MSEQAKSPVTWAVWPIWALATTLGVITGFALACLLQQSHKQASLGHIAAMD